MNWRGMTVKESRFYSNFYSKYSNIPNSPNYTPVKIFVNRVTDRVSFVAGNNGTNYTTIYLTKTKKNNFFLVLLSKI